jgi:hypothetical protein
MATQQEAQDAILELIKKAAETSLTRSDEVKQARVTLDLAEATAWIISPNNAHGSGGPT